MIDTETIKKKRKALGMTQEDLAKKCGVSWQSISNLERKKNISHELLSQVCGILELELRIVDTMPIEEKPKKEERVQLID